MSSAVARTAAAMAALGLALSGCAASIHGDCQAQSRRPDQDERHDLPRSGAPRTSAPSTSTSATPPTSPTSTSAPQVAPPSRRAATGWSTTHAPRASCSRPTCCRPAAPQRPRPRRPTIRASAARCWAVPPAAPPATGWARPASASTMPSAPIGGALAGCRDLVGRRRLRPGHHLHHRHRRPGLRTGCRAAVISQSEQANLNQGTPARSPRRAARPPTPSATGPGSSARPTRPISTGAQAEPELVAGLTRSIGGIF